MNKAFAEAVELPKVKSGQISNYGQYLHVCQEVLEFIQADDEFLIQYKASIGQSKQLSRVGNYSD